MKKVSLWGIGEQAKSPNVSKVHRLNMYLEFTPQLKEDKTLVTAYGTPGLSSPFVNFGDTPVRGSYEKGDYAYFVHRGVLWRVDNAGNKTSLGLLETSVGNVSFSDNGVQIAIVDGYGLYIYNTSPAVPAVISSSTNVGTTATVNTATAYNLNDGQSITRTGASPSAYNGTFNIAQVDTDTFTYTMLSDPGGPATVQGTYTVNAFQKVELGTVRPQSITFLAGYFVASILNSGRYYISGIYNGLSWPSLDFANAESNPDDLISVIAENGQLKLFGQKTTEFHGVSGGQEFPFSAIQGSAIEWGLAARFSLSKSDNSLMFLGRNREGEVKVISLQGYAPVDVTGTDMAHIFNDGNEVSDATAFSYMQDAHSMYQITFPTMGETWLYDSSTGAWSQLQSNGISRHRAETYTQYINRRLVSDYENGNVYFLDKNVSTDNGEMIARRLTGRHINNSGEMLALSKLQIEMETGKGLATGQGSDPVALLRISRDNGHTWGNQRRIGLGKIGEYRTRAIANRLGRGRDFVFELTITDPIQVAITGAYLQ